MSVEASLVQGWLISPFILLPEILKNLEALSKKNSLVDDLMQTPQTPQLCSAKSKVTLYQPVTSIWRVCSKQNRCRHFQIYCLLQFPCNFGINWKKGCAEILLQQKKTAPTFAPSLRMPAVKRPSQSKSSILITGSHTSNPSRSLQSTSSSFTKKWREIWRARFLCPRRGWRFWWGSKSLCFGKWKKCLKIGKIVKPYLRSRHIEMS